MTAIQRLEIEIDSWQEKINCLKVEVIEVEVVEEEDDNEYSMYQVIEHLTTPFPEWDEVSGISKEIKQILGLFF